MGKRTCEECGAVLVGPPSVVQRRRWCSWACRTAKPRSNRSPAALVTYVCESCGEAGVRLAKRPSPRFCSLKCRDAVIPVQRRKRITVTCRFCGGLFERRPSEIAAGRGKFCSKECAGKGRPICGRPSRVASEAISLWAAQTAEQFTTEHRVGRFSIDLALPHRRVAVELDGVYWHSLPEMVERDVRKDAALAAEGWRVVRIGIASNMSPRDLAGLIDEAVKSL